MSSVKAIPKGLSGLSANVVLEGRTPPYVTFLSRIPCRMPSRRTKRPPLKVAVWAFRTPEQFLLHVRSAIHACKQMGLDTDFAAAEKAVETAKIEAELAKQESQGRDDKVLKALEDVKLAVATTGAKPFKLYGNLLSDEARQPWEKIIKAQVTKAPWEDIKGVPHMETPTKTWNLFHECITFHLLQVFRHDAGEALKYYITNTLKKPNRVSIHQFFVRVEQLNSYLKTLPCLYYSPKANQTTKKVLPLDDADLATHLLRMCPAKWQTQYDLTENTTPVSTRALLLVLENIENNVELDNKPANTAKAKGADMKRKMESMDSRVPKKPKKVGWTEKHCVLCKKHGGRTRVTIRVTAVAITKTVLLSKRMGAQVSPVQKKGNRRARTLPR
eukprot:CCRYP_011629-RA/>CCRYP_011629-RA protein AED:0.39 eAED:0.94 QI:0/0/0/1/1/1/2/0/386